MAKLFDKLGKIIGFDYDEDEYEDEDEEITEEESVIEPVFQKKNTNNGKVVSIHSANSAKVTITKPVTFEEATEICDAIKSRKIVVVNTTSLDNRIAQRLLDFVSGACYALEGELQEVEKGVYLLSPSNVEVTNELKSELTNKGLFNWSK